MSSSMSSSPSLQRGATWTAAQRDQHSAPSSPSLHVGQHAPIPAANWQRAAEQPSAYLPRSTAGPTSEQDQAGQPGGERRNARPDGRIRAETGREQWMSGSGPRVPVSAARQ